MPIKHVVVIIQENHSFDNYFGTYPGANGINENASMSDKNNTYDVIIPYPLSASVPTRIPCNTSHCAYVSYDNGKMDGFFRAEHASLIMGYYNSTYVPYYWDYASQFVLLDNYFSSVMGDSLPNHLYLIAGQSGGITHDLPSDSPLTVNIPTIIDELDAKQISWKFYHGGFNPTQYVASLKTGPNLANVVPEKEFILDITNKSLPDVVWINPIQSEEPPQNIIIGEHKVSYLINAIMKSDYWNSTAIFITWDDWGGWYDHVPPPPVDKFGYGFRVPLLVISPYAKQGFIDHTLSDHTSILKFIETLYSLSPLTERDASANNLTEAFDFSQSPRPALLLPGPYISDHYPLELKSNQTIPEFGQIASFALAIALASTIIVKFRKK